MNREEASKEIQAIKSKNILLELVTSFGKTKQALDIMVKRNPKNILILVPRLVLIQNWKDEFVKWKMDKYLKRVTFSTYVGIKKHEGESFDMLIADECHHFTDKSLDVISTMTFKYSTLLSGTVIDSKKAALRASFKDLYCYKITMKQAQEEVLAEPKVYLIPYTLDNTDRKYPFELRESAKGKSITCDYSDKWKYLKDKSYTTVIVNCTQQEYINELSAKIDYWKRMYMRGRNEVFKNKWLYLAGLRLRMLSNFKTSIVSNLQVHLRKQRCLTFCNSIEQTETLGKNCINSNNKDSDKVLEQFNKGEVNQITSCNMLNEGMNLVDCQVGIYASLNSSEVMIKQKLGRILRHSNPVLIIPYYKNTREEEILETMLEDYNPELVEIVESLNQIKV